MAVHTTSQNPLLFFVRSYTSLGGTTDTHPNPALIEGGEAGSKATFRPAYELMEDHAERLGRDR